MHRSVNRLQWGLLSRACCLFLADPPEWLQHKSTVTVSPSVLLKAIGLCINDVTSLPQTRNFCCRSNFCFSADKFVSALIVNGHSRKISSVFMQSFSYNFKHHHMWKPTYPFYSLVFKFSARSDQTVNSASRCWLQQRPTSL